ncbi:MAG TPA: hypothetical protein VFW55_06690 [Propionicimonas sp.]|nr:hypothetical protein [Propionicimonas sp.]
MTAPTQVSTAGFGAAAPVPGRNLPTPAAAPAGQPEFAPPPPSRTPQLLRQLQVVAALVLLVLGGVGTLLITQLRSDLDSAPQVAAQSARLGEVQTRLLSAATLAGEGVLKVAGAPANQAADAGTKVGEASALLIEAATARPQDAEALAELSSEVSAYGAALRAADGRDTATGRDLLANAGKQLDTQILPDLAALQKSLAAEASADSTGLAFVMPVLGTAAAAFLIWVSWVVAQKSRRVLNLGLVGAVVGVLVISWVTLAAQQGTAVAVGQSRGAQFARVTGLNTASSQVDTARRIQAEALLARSWPDAQAKAVTAAIDAAGKAADTTSTRSQLSSYRTAADALSRLMAKADWVGAGKLALSTDKSGVAATSAAFQKSVAEGRVQATTAAAEAADEVRSGLPWQLAAVILATLVGAGLAVVGLAQRLVEYR